MDATTPVSTDDTRLVTGLEARIATDRARAARIRVRADELDHATLQPLRAAMRRRASELELMVRAHQAIREGLVGTPDRGTPQPTAA